MEKILITGATGFVGSHLTELCVEKGYKVVAFDRYNRNYNLGWLEQSKYKSDIEFVFGDIRDYDSVLKTMKGCQTVFHLAALIGIPYSYLSPLAYLKTNTEGTYNVLEAMRRNGVKKIVYTSSGTVYGDTPVIPIPETYGPTHPISLYGAGKLAGEALITAFCHTFEIVHEYKRVYINLFV